MPLAHAQLLVVSFPLPFSLSSTVFQSTPHVHMSIFSKNFRPLLFSLPPVPWFPFTLISSIYWLSCRYFFFWYTQTILIYHYQVIFPYIFILNSIPPSYISHISHINTLVSATFILISSFLFNTPSALGSIHHCCWPHNRFILKFPSVCFHHTILLSLCATLSGHI